MSWGFVTIKEIGEAGEEGKILEKEKVTGTIKVQLNTIKILLNFLK